MHKLYQRSNIMYKTHMFLMEKLVFTFDKYPQKVVLTIHYMK